MLSTLPPLKALRAFEAAARHLNVTRAAEELSVTQPAVTQQIRALEAFLGLQLVYRAGQGLALTPAGRSYADHLQSAFTEIDTATAELLTREKHGGPLTVSLLPTLAQRWLIPRLGSFQTKHPEIEVHFSTTARLVDLRREDVDVAIRFGEGTWPGCDSTFLMANDMFPVIGAQLQAVQPVSKPEDLARHTWLRVDAEPRSHDWNAWLASAGASGLEPKGWVAFESSSQALAAAAAGIGVAIGHRPFVLDDLSSGRLVQPLGAVVESKQAYYVVTPAGVPVSMRVAAFRSWLLAEAQQGNAPST